MPVTLVPLEAADARTELAPDDSYSRFNWPELAYKAQNKAHWVLYSIRSGRAEVGRARTHLALPTTPTLIPQAWCSWST